MEYLKMKSISILGRQEAWYAPIDKYMGKKDGFELWLPGDAEKEEPYERYHSWYPVDAKTVVELKRVMEERFLKKYMVPYQKELYEKGCLIIE